MPGKVDKKLSFESLFSEDEGSMEFFRLLSPSSIELLPSYFIEPVPSRVSTLSVEVATTDRLLIITSPKKMVVKTTILLNFIKRPVLLTYIK